jgi:DNA-binding CsgD family transcriptional regulator
LIHVLLDLGDLPGAARHLEKVRDFPRGGEGVRLYAEADARYALVTGDAERALLLFESVQDQMTTVLNPVWRPWRSLRACALLPLGRGAEALSLVTEELALARRWGTPALVGTTLHCLGEIQAETADEEAVPTLREAVDTLAASPRRLEEARALASLGRRLLGLGSARDEARGCLQRALDLAGQCAARGLRSEVADILQSLGVTAPVEVDPRYELTAAERRIVAMAAEGLAPSEIAQALFVTSHTVQATVASVSQRLGVSSFGAVIDQAGSTAPAESNGHTGARERS